MRLALQTLFAAASSLSLASCSLLTCTRANPRAFYYYQTEDHQPGKRGPPYTPGKTYEETLIDVKAYADQEGIPYKYVLLDSWWYYQGEGSGVTNWIGRPDIFPHGNDYLRNATGWPIMGHNRCAPPRLV